MFLAVVAALVCGGGTIGQAYDWQPAGTKADLMVVGAHLDDEGIYLGGTMPYYAGALGKSTVHISMTSGDSSVPTATREAESYAVDWSYGVRIAPVYGHFKDWAMGSQAPYTKLQRNWSLWYEPDPGPARLLPNGTIQTALSPFPNNTPVGEANPAEFDPGRWKVATFLAKQIRLYKPEVIVTHDLEGESRHSNHITTAWGVWDAFYLAADPTVDIEGLPAWQSQKLYFHLFNRASPPAPNTSLPGTAYPAGTSIMNTLYEDWSVPNDALGGKTPLQVANDGISMYASIGGPKLLTQFSTRYSEQYGLYASTVGADTVGADGWAHGGMFEHVPEPCSLALLAAGALAVLRRRKR
jgi:LmbE family N-acetylglucosaminyl deacetylase